MFLCLSKFFLNTWKIALAFAVKNPKGGEGCKSNNIWVNKLFLLSLSVNLKTKIQCFAAESRIRLPLPLQLMDISNM